MFSQLSRFLVLTISLVSALTFSVYAQWSEDKLRVVGTFSIAADIAAEIGGEKAQVNSLIPIGADPHLYEPVPGDVEVLRKADVIFANGLKLEGWLDKLIESAGVDAKVVRITEGIRVIENGKLADVNHVHNADQGLDPHAWMDPLNGKIYASNIAKALVGLRPQHQAYFEKRLSKYHKELDAVHTLGINLMREIPQQHRYLITTHDAFNYLAMRYGLKVVPLMGVSTEADVRTQDIQDAVAVIESTGVPAIFGESTTNPKLMRRLQEDYNVALGDNLYADSLGDSTSGADTYLKLLRHNLRSIHAGLSGQLNRSTDTPPTLQLTVLTGVFVLAFIVVALMLKRRTTARCDQTYTLTIEKLSASYGNKLALKDVSVTLKSGVIHGLIGPNGSGKSTLIKAILGLKAPEAGSVTLNGESLKTFAGSIAYVPQKDEVDWQFPATVRDVVTMGRYPHKSVFGQLTSHDREKVEQAMQRVGITDLAKRQIGELSGGQQRRTFLARALAQEADVFLLDEPFAGIDRATEAAILALLRELADAGKFILIIHHDLSKVEQFFDDAILLNTKLVAYGPSREVCRPEVLNQVFSAPAPTPQL